jgi:hypothetical protein
MKPKPLMKQALAGVMLASLITPTWAQDETPKQQTEEEFQSLLPITGTVETMAGNFELDHAFPAPGEADKIYDLMDHQRATQLYLWGLPIVGMTRWHLGMVDNYPDYDYNKIVAVKTFNERRGILTANETTDYFWGFGNTRDSAVILEIPPGVAVGMINDMWEQSPGDYGIFGPNGGAGDLVAVVGPNTPAEMVPERSDDLRIMEIGTDQTFWLFRLVGTPEEVDVFTQNLKIYNYGEDPTPVDIIPGEDKFTAEYQPRGLAYWEMLHTAINREVVQDRDRFFMYWLRQLGIEKGKPFNPTERQREILIDAAETGELMAKALVYNERMDGVLRQNNWRMILGGEWGDGHKYTNRMKYWDAIDPRSRYTYEAITTSPAMTMPKPGKAQLYIGKFEDESGQRLKGGENYVIRVEKDVPANLFWSIVIYDTDTRTIIDNRAGAAGGKATVGSKTEGVRMNDDGSFYVLLGPDAPPEGWEANHVQTLPGRGWFPYMRMYGAEESAFNDEYKFPTVNKVADFSDYIQ